MLQQHLKIRWADTFRTDCMWFEQLNVRKAKEDKITIVDLIQKKCKQYRYLKCYCCENTAVNDFDPTELVVTILSPDG